MSSARDLVIEHTFAAPRGRVFDAWSTPEVLRRWWGAGPDWTSPDVTIDLRTGGGYRLSMSDPETGGVYVVGGEYLEVDPPRRLVFTWAWETPGSPTGDLTTLVTVEFHEAAEDQTTIVLTHSGFADPGQGDLHAEGWQACLTNLRDRIFPQKAS